MPLLFVPMKGISFYIIEVQAEIQLWVSEDGLQYNSHNNKFDSMPFQCTNLLVFHRKKSLLFQFSSCKKASFLPRKNLPSESALSVMELPSYFS